MTLVELYGGSDAGACIGVAGAGQLCAARALPGQVYCKDHLDGALRMRQRAEAELDAARTDVLARTARRMGAMVDVLAGIAESAAAEDADRIRAAKVLLDVGGMTKVPSVNVANVHVDMRQQTGELTETDARLLTLMERLGPEGAAKAAELRSVIEVREA